MSGAADCTCGRKRRTAEQIGASLAQITTEGEAAAMLSDPGDGERARARLFLVGYLGRGLCVLSAELLGLCPACADRQAAAAVKGAAHG